MEGSSESTSEVPDALATARCIGAGGMMTLLFWGANFLRDEGDGFRNEAEVASAEGHTMSTREPTGTTSAFENTISNHVVDGNDQELTIISDRTDR